MRTIKQIGTAVHAKLTIPADVARTYRQANIKVFLFTSQNESHDARMITLKPYGVTVNDVARFQRCIRVETSVSDESGYGGIP